MKALLFLLILALLPFSAAAEETVDPFAVTELNLTAETAPAENPTVLRGVDFAGGAALMRLRGVSDSQLSVTVYLDSMDSYPLATATFTPKFAERRREVSLSGVHDLYIVVSGSGTFVSIQAFAGEKEWDDALRAERGVRCDDAVPNWAAKDCPRGGAVVKFTYQAHDWFNDEQTVYEKAAYVYLPYGYDPESTYDLMILCHGIGGNEAEWGLADKSSRVKNIMDNLIDSGAIRPFIVVTPNGRAGKTNDYGAFYLFDRELREDLLPALADKYAVDVANRERCAMAGLSMGGMQTINLGIGRCLDLFCAFGAFSAAPTSNAAAETAAVLDENRDLPVKMFYNICGTEDNVALASATMAFRDIAGMTEQLSEDNFIVQLVPGGHDFTVWYLGFYNFARLFAGIE